MSAAPTVALATTIAQTDAELVAAVRAGDDAGFEELYRRYYRRIATFVRRLVNDPARAEDVTQEAFLSALRRLRVTDSEIAFKPWIYEIARNGSIDLYRRTSRAEEVSMDNDEALRSSDRGRLVGSVAPESALFAKERMDHLRGALDELSDTHHRVIVMRELEGLSYREIGDRLDLSRPAVESTLFRARRRLEREYEELEAGRRCEAIMQAIGRLAEGVESEADRLRLERHARRCSGCRRRARELGIEPLRRRGVRRAAAVLPLPGLIRRRGSGAAVSTSASTKAGGVFGSLVAPGAGLGGFLGERAATLIAAVALAGAGGAALSTSTFDEPGSGAERPAAERQVEEAPGTPGVPLRDGGEATPSPAPAGRPGAGSPAPGPNRATPSQPLDLRPSLGGALEAPKPPVVPDLPSVDQPELPTLPPVGSGGEMDLLPLRPDLPEQKPPAVPGASKSVTLPSLRGAPASAPALPASAPALPASAPALPASLP